MQRKNKAVKRIIGIVSITCVVWSGLFLTDYERSSTLREPMFALPAGTEQGKSLFRGLGYRVEVTKNAEEVITSVAMTMFGKVISSSGT